MHDKALTQVALDARSCYNPDLEKDDRMSLGNLITMARIDRLTMSIGEDEFGQVLAECARAVGDADHLMIFAFTPRVPPRGVVSAGQIEPKIAERSCADYANSLYLLDPNYAEIRSHRGEAARWFPLLRQTDYCDNFRTMFLDACEISDILPFVVNQDGVAYYVLFMQTGGRIFAGAQQWLLNQVGELMAASVRKHFSYIHALKGQNQFLMGRVLSDSPAFSAVTPRERLVCVGILTGHTSESISLNLSISVNSVLTYRKRLYEKLGISSQNELFGRVIAAMMELSQSDGRAERLALRDALDPAGFEIGTISRDAYLAEALLA